MRMKNKSVEGFEKIHVLRFSIILLLVLSVAFPFLFSIITANFVPRRFIIDVGMTALLNILSVVIIYLVTLVFNLMMGNKKHRWYRYLIEYPVILYVSFWHLYFYFVLMTGNSNYASYLLNVGWQFRLYIVVNLIGCSFIYLFVTSLNLYRLLQEKAAQTARLQKEYAQLFLQALKSQVNPHFLFNSLSVLSSLVHVSAETSERFIIQLSKAYRYILDQKETALVTLKEELDFLDAYFFLMQIRFEKKIQLHKHINDNTEVLKLPPLTLQMLVENALKHNKMSNAEPLQISVTQKDNLLVVENNINLREQYEKSTGIGLQNIIKRYELITDKKPDIQQNNQSFTVTIPLLN